MPPDYTVHKWIFFHIFSADLHVPRHGRLFTFTISSLHQFLFNRQISLTPFWCIGCEMNILLWWCSSEITIVINKGNKVQVNKAITVDWSNRRAVTCEILTEENIGKAFFFFLVVVTLAWWSQVIRIGETKMVGDHDEYDFHWVTISTWWVSDQTRNLPSCKMDNQSSSLRCIRYRSR